MANQYRGYATEFADPLDLLHYNLAKRAGKSEPYALSVGDNGVGAPPLGTVDTTDAYGVAVPRKQLIKQFGNDPAAWRRARALVTYKGQTVQAPIIDFGPGSKPQRRGVITDLSYPLSKAMGSNGMAKVDMQLVGDAGPDYKNEQDDWQAEQDKIASQLSPSSYGASMAASVPSEEKGAYVGPDLSEAIKRQQAASDLTELS
jgi:hypothetical protein